ncbi:MAG: two-component system regulatory protein YycI [Lactobacillaceae bacterium]|nr:two-component system regulatory protein YycI [Lactobacillaceae bacterium]
MDFKKILVIFLGVFIVIDIFLAVQVVFFNETARDLTTPDTVLTELHNDNISFTPPSTKHQTGVYISGDFNTKYLKNEVKSIPDKAKFDDAEGTMTVKVSNPEVLGENLTQAQKQISKLLKSTKKVIAGKQYVYDANMTKVANTMPHSGHILIYSQVLAGNREIMGVEGRIQFKLTSTYEVDEYTQSYIVNAQVLRDAAEVISEQNALIGLYQYNELPNNGKVLWTKLAYTQLTTVEKDTIFVPTWVVAVENSANTVSVLRVNAFDGSLMK